jgi:predicted dithiol-disulfide oxidoreductase (DUF899 family)
LLAAFIPEEEDASMTAPTTAHRIGTREQWLAARLELLTAEKALTRRSDEGDARSC